MPSTSPRAAKNWKVPTRIWLEATRVRTAPGKGVSRQTVSPVVTAARVRVVGIPSAAIASLTMYSRRTGPSAARPSPLPGERSRARALELDVTAHTIAIDNLAQKNGASVTELRHEVPKLVAGISHGERLASLGHAVAGEDCHAFRRGELRRIEPEMSGERFVQLHQTGRSDRSGWKPRKKSVRQTRVTVIESEEIGRFGLCRHDSSNASHSNSKNRQRLARSYDALGG